MKPLQSPEQQAAERVFVDKAMDLVQRKIYPEGVTESVWAREYPDLLMAISEPAAWLRELGFNAGAGVYLRIIREVLGQIGGQGESKMSHNRPMYLRQSLQAYMRDHSDDLIMEAKSGVVPKNTFQAGGLAASVIARIRTAEGDPEAVWLTAVLKAARGLLTPSRLAKPRVARCPR